MNRQYLGDSVYVEYEDGMFVLTTDNGLGSSNRIYLELPVFQALAYYVEKTVEDFRRRRELES